MQERPTFKKLMFPILIEMLLTILIGAVDTLMLSVVGDKLVGAVGTSNSYLSLFSILFSVISMGLTAVMTQYIGAKKQACANRAHILAVCVNAAFGIALGLTFFFGTSPLLRLLKVADELIDFAARYMQIIGTCFLIDSVAPLFASYLKAHGKTHFPMISSLCANVINVGLNATFIFTRSSDMGAITGVAIASVSAKAFSLGMNIVFFFLKRQKATEKRDLTDRQILRDILKIGFPSALETIIYNICSAVVTYCLNTMSADGFNITVNAYCAQIANFAYITGASMAYANAITAGWKIGEGKLDECYKSTLNILKYNIMISVGAALVLALIGKFLLNAFTDDEQIIKVGTSVLYIDILLEFGRATNLTLGTALKTSGDAAFTVVIAVIFMITCAAAGSFLLGNVAGLLVRGVWLAKAIDEVGRGVFMGLRWRSKKWQGKALIKQAPTEAPAAAEQAPVEEQVDEEIKEEDGAAEGPRA